MRKKILFCDNWKFHDGDIELVEPDYKGIMYMQAKTEKKKAGPACKDFIDSMDDNMYGEMPVYSWQTVTLPHDYIIEQTPCEKYNNALGYFDYHNAWYRKHFKVDAEYSGKRISLYFEGIATKADIYLNGCLLKHSYCAYTGFELDITDFVKFDGDNVIAVYVNAKDHEGWWYEGAGINKNVWMTVTDPVCVDMWGVYVVPKRESGNTWNVIVETDVRNDTYSSADVSVTHVIYDDSGVLGKVGGQVSVCRREVAKITHNMECNNPELWDIDSPHMYYVKTVLSDNTDNTDEVITRFGFREFRMDANTGFYLNGRHVKIKGVCAHQDFGLTGRAVPEI